MLDVLDSVKEWRSFVSGLASLDIATVSGVLSLRHRLGDTGGFVVAQAFLSCDLGARFTLDFHVRYRGDPVTLEIKFVSADGKDVWRSVRSLSGHDDCALSLGGHDFEYAWGESGAGRPAVIGQIEFALVSRVACSGALDIVSPRISCLPAVEPVYSVITSSGSADGSSRVTLGSAHALLDIGWRANHPDDLLEVDLGFNEWISGIHLQFPDAPEGVSVSVQVRAVDNHVWQVVASPELVTARALWLPIKHIIARWLRLCWTGGAVSPRVVRFEAITLEQARTPNEFASVVAKAMPRGHRPASLLGEQVWWTCVSSPDAGRQALINEHGAVEFGFASPTLEPSWIDPDGWHGWHDAVSCCSLDGAMPMPMVDLSWPDRRLRVKPQWVTSHTGLQVRYEWFNDTSRVLEFDFLLSLAPFQISPPSQQHGVVGGRSPVNALEPDGTALVINGQYRWSASCAPRECRLASGVQSDPRFTTQSGPGRVEDDRTGNATAVWVWSVTLAPGQMWSVDVMIGELGHPAAVSVPWPDPLQHRTKLMTDWESTLAAIDVELPPSHQDAITCWRHCVAHILGNRQGHMINPGPRRYARSWIRDAASMGEALLKAGRLSEVMAFVDTYGGFVAPDGYVPCCVDLDGSADPLVEHDSHGQWIYLVTQVFRYSGDHAFLQRHALRSFAAADYIMALRRQRLVDPWFDGSRRAACGLIPESVSHEGYLAQPVHSYWDDVWCLRGLEDAAWLATVLSDAALANRYATEAADFKAAIGRSISAVQQERGVDYVPGSVEWADLDPSASACGPAQLGFSDLYPGNSMYRTMSLFMEHWRERVVNGRSLTKYSAYDIRVVRALVNLDRRDEAHELLDFLLADRRPLAWQQWPEISWPDPASAGHVGDLPHTWISAEYVLAIRSCLVEESHDGLLLMRGVPVRWLEEGPVTVRSLPTPYGPVGFRVSLDVGHLVFQWLLQPSCETPVVLRLLSEDIALERHEIPQYFPV